MTDITVPLKIKFPLAPKKGRLTVEDMKECLHVEPMAKLPTYFVPEFDGSRLKSRPPKFHYGWILEDSDILLRIARRKKIPLRNRTGKGTVFKLPPKGSMAADWMKEDTLDAIAKELDLCVDPYLVDVFSPGREATMIAFTNNYEVSDRVVTRRDVDEMQKYLKLEGSPMWYLDYYEWTWNSQRFWDRS